MCKSASTYLPQGPFFTANASIWGHVMSLIREDMLMGMGFDLALCPYLAIRLGRPDVCMVIDAASMRHLDTKTAPRSGYSRVYRRETALTRRTVEGHGLPGDIMVTFGDKDKQKMTTLVCIPPGRVSPDGGAEVWEGKRDWPWAGVRGRSSSQT
jgi:hypothetical protein